MKFLKHLYNKYRSIFDKYSLLFAFYITVLFYGAIQLSMAYPEYERHILNTWMFGLTFLLIRVYSRTKDE